MTTSNRKKRRKHRTISYGGLSIRLLPTGKWQTDNNNRADRERLSWDTLEKAKAHADQKETEVANYGREAYKLDSTARQDAVKALSELAGRATLKQAVEFWKQHHPDGGAIPLSEKVAEWLAEMELNGRRPPTIRDARNKLAAFMREIGEDTPCASVTDKAVRQFILNQDCAPVTRNGWRRVLGTFFEFCIRRKILLLNPALGVEIVRLDEKMPAFMPQKTVEKLLKAAEKKHPEAVPALAVAFFAGLRPSEIGGGYRLEDEDVTKAKKKVREAKELLEEAQKHGSKKAAKETEEAVKAASQELKEAMATARRSKGNKPSVIGGLQWEDVNLADKTIRVRPETSKNRRTRLVEISDNLLAWLAKYYKATGPVAPPPPTFKRYRQDAMEEAGLKSWVADWPRHSFATFHFAQHENQDKLAAMMGHTGGAGMLYRHYKGLVSKAEAKKYWAIEPVDATTGQTFQLATATGA